MADKDKKPELMNQTEADFIEEANQRWEAGETFLGDTIAHGTLCLQAIEGKEEAQWDKVLLAARKDQKRPYLIENMLPAFVRQVTGDFRMNTPSSKVIMESLDADPEIAEVLQGKIYRIRYNSQAEAIHQNAFEQALQFSYGAWGLLTRYKDNESDDQEMYIRGFENPACLRWDPNTKLPDTSDKEWVMIYEAVPKKTAEKKWPDADWGTGVDTPKGASDSLWWGEDFYGVREYIYICDTPKTIYTLEDGTKTTELPEGVKAAKKRKAYDRKIYSCIINGKGIIEGPEELVWKKAIPIFLTLGEQLVIEGKKSFKTLVSDAIGIQHLHNYWITALTESIAIQPDAPYVGTKKHFEGVESYWNGTKKTAYRPYNHDPQAPGGPRREMPPQLSPALWQMPQYTKSAARDTIGIHEAGLGMKSNETSGIAIQRRQQESDIGTFVFVSNFRRALEFEGRCMIEGIQQIDFAAGKHIVMGIDAEQKTIEIAKPLDIGTYGTMVTIGPSMTSQRQEARQTMTELLQIAGQANPTGVAAVFPKVVKAMDMPDAHEIAEIFAATLPPEIRQQFYSEGKDGKGNQPINIPPEMEAQIQQLQQNFAQVQELAQAQAQEIESLKRGEAVKMAEIAAKKEISEAELTVEREKIAAESALKEKEIMSKYDLERQKNEAEIATKLQSLRDELDAKKYMHEVEQELKQANIEVEREGAEISLKGMEGIEGAEGMMEGGGKMEGMKGGKSSGRPIVVPYRVKGTQVVKITGPSGQVYTGEVTSA